MEEIWRNEIVMGKVGQVFSKVSTSFLFVCLGSDEYLSEMYDCKFKGRLGSAGIQLLSIIS